MILFSPSKINIGLYVMRKREDGFHNISTLMYPIPLKDIIEIQTENVNVDKFSISMTGIKIPLEIESNLCYKAWKLFCENVIPLAVKIHLHKSIPLGAGLGGGSSNAAIVLKGLNELTGTTQSNSQLQALASKLGSDCSFFIESTPSLAEGRGEILTKHKLDLSGYYLVLLNPGININTAYAYSKLTPNDKRENLLHILDLDIKHWRKELINDFESVIFKEHPQIENLKSACYASGAVYASMSGSGASVYGIFNQEPYFDTEIKKQIIWQGLL